MSNEEKMYFFTLGVPEGYYGVRMEIMTSKSKEVRENYMYGYAAGQKLRTELTDDEKTEWFVNRNEHIKRMGYKVGYMKYEATSSKLQEEELKIFNEGLELGIRERDIEEAAIKLYKDFNNKR